MYPGQTSLIPVQVALARFLESQGPKAIFSHYPYWYLGSTPFRYLTGPVLPGGLVLLHKLIPGLNFFELFFGLMVVCWLFSGVGVYFLVRLLSRPKEAEQSAKNSLTPFLTAFFYLLGPFVFFLFPFSDGLSLIAFTFLPWFFILYTKSLQQPKAKYDILLCILICFIILTHTLIMPSLFLGMMAVLLAVSGWKKIELKIKKTLRIILYALLFATIWYMPGYWVRVLLAPSFAGKPFFKVVFEVGQLLPLGLAFYLGVHKLKSKNPLFKFCFYWLFSFGFLTFLRFIADPDFWLDWSAYGMELQLGMSILLGLLIDRFRQRYRNQLILVPVLAFYLLLFCLIFKKWVLGTLQKEINQSIEYKIGSQLVKIAKRDETVFLSGTSVFWLNAFYDIPQVRGGVDQASANADWRKAAWEIREGQDPEKSREWLRKLGVRYLVVHTFKSGEFYHDFKFPDKFEGFPGMQKILDYEGDRIYQVSE
ncbi:MAG TPA: hypothetical protein VMW29_00330 [Candidatus Bathyarchaeia archaeon]|nr:hypothetical protein [Candidatus Bathyarchaeia archaeon]